MTTSFTLNSPATAERIRMACADRIVEVSRRFILSFITILEQYGSSRLRASPMQTMQSTVGCSVAPLGQ